MRLARPRTIALAAAVAVALPVAACGNDGDAPSIEGNEDLFTSAGFGEAVDAVSESAGSDATLLSVQVTPAGANFRIREGEQARGLIYTGGSLEEVEIDVVGPGTLGEDDFPLAEVDPDAIDRIVAAAKEESGSDDLRITALTLAPTPPEGEPKWTINAEGSERGALVFSADPDGSGLTAATGAGEKAGQAANP